MVEFGPDAKRRTRKGLLDVFRNLARNGSMIREMTWVSLTAQFKKSAIGATWIVLFPVFNIVVWLFLHGVGVIDPGDTGVPYPVYLLLGLTMWFFFMGYYRAASLAIAQGGRLFLQVSFPHEVYLAQRLIVSSVNGLIPIALTLMVIPIWGIVPHWHAVFLPLALLPLALFGAAVGLFVSVLRVVAVDAFNVINRVMDLVMYVTPVVYATQAGGSALQTVIAWNPLTYLLGTCRQLVLTGQVDDPQTYLFLVAGSLIFFLLSLKVFVTAEPRVLEKLVL